MKKQEIESQQVKFNRYNDQRIKIAYGIASRLQECLEKSGHGYTEVSRALVTTLKEMITNPLGNFIADVHPMDEIAALKQEIADKDQYILKMVDKYTELYEKVFALLKENQPTNPKEENYAKSSRFYGI